MAPKVIRTPRDFPSVEELLQWPTLSEPVSELPRPVATDVVRRIIADFKQLLSDDDTELTLEMLSARIRSELEALKRTETTRVINATGIVVHTNLGRAPLSDTHIESVKGVLTGYGNIEFDLNKGSRGRRGDACERYLAVLAGSEAATVVNNCAAALFMVLNTLANRKQVLISRGELVQIGGGFRIPDILRKSGARLVEVGTTNITTLSDYESALDDHTGIILKVHKSNFIQAGFTEEVPLRRLVDLSRPRRVPVAHDLGSGAVASTRPFIGYEEPTVQSSVREGAALTCFSADKMLGGVQAGLIVGGAEFVRKIKRNALFRTVRVDKIVFSVLERLLAAYLNGRHLDEIKLWRLLAVPESELYRRAKRLLADLGDPPDLTTEATRAYLGGGALPQYHIPSVGIVFSGGYRAAVLMREFRALDPPVIGRIESDRFILDLKAVDRDELPLLRDAVKRRLRG